MKWFNDLKIKTKLLVTFTIIALFSTFIGIFGYIKLNSIDGIVKDMYDNRINPIIDLGNARAALLTARGDMRNLMLSKTLEERVSFNKKIVDNLEKVDNLIDIYSKTLLIESETENLSHFNENYKNYKADRERVWELASQMKDDEALLLLNGDVRKYLLESNTALAKLMEINSAVCKENYSRSHNETSSAQTLIIILVIASFSTAIGFGFLIANRIKSSIDKVLNMAQEICKGHVKARANVNTKDELGEMGKALDQFIYQVETSICGVLNMIAAGDVSITVPMYDEKDEIAPVLNKVIDTVRNLITEVNGLTEAAINGNLEKRGNASNYQGGYKQIVAGFNNTLDTIIQNVRDYEAVVERVGKGDLTARMEGDYRGNYKVLQENANNFAKSLNALILKVHEATQATASSANEISSSAEEMAAGSHEQSQQTTEIAGAVEQMTKTIIETSKYASDAAENSKIATESAVDGAKKVEETKKGMQRIVESTRATGMKLSSLARRTDQIGEITQVIDDIADQTNLLALNAAIEAARAGEQGRGFAVVADEVRKLAERTTKATKEIADTIKEIQNEAKEADISMDESYKAVEEGMQLTEGVASGLHKIMDINKKVSDTVIQVAAASEEQSITAEQISKNIEGISSVTQQSAAGTEQIARAAEDLNRLTVNLQELVSTFKITDKETLHSSRHDGNILQAAHVKTFSHS